MDMDMGDCQMSGGGNQSNQAIQSANRRDGAKHSRHSTAVAVAALAVAAAGAQPPTEATSAPKNVAQSVGSGLGRVPSLATLFRHVCARTHMTLTLCTPLSPPLLHLPRRIYLSLGCCC